jgi:hypothetical protein
MEASALLRSRPKRTVSFREEFRAPARRTKVPEERTRGVQVALWGFRVLAPGGGLWCSVQAWPGFALGSRSLSVFSEEERRQAGQDDAGRLVGRAAHASIRSPRRGCCDVRRWPAVPGHGGIIPAGACAGGGARGWHHCPKLSMMRMRPPQQGQGGVGSDASAGSAGSGGGA